MMKKIMYLFTLCVLVTALACEDSSVTPVSPAERVNESNITARLATRTITVNNMKTGTITATANLYYKINSGSWTLLTNAFTSSTCVQRGTFNANDGDVIYFAIEQAVNSDCIPFWASATGTCVNTGMLYYGYRSGGTNYSHTVSADVTLSITAKAVGDTWWVCPN